MIRANAFKKCVGVAAVVFFSIFGCDDDSSIKTTTVADAKNLRDGADVRISGNLDSLIVGEWYWFSDNTGSITVEIENEVWGRSGVSPANLTFPVPVEIVGEVEKDRGQAVIIEVDRLTRLF